MKIAMTSPRLSILVSKLVEEEYIMREFIIKATVNMSIQPPIPREFSVIEDDLPIGSLSKLLEEKRSSCNFGFVTRDQEFITECKKLVEKCYKVILA